MSEVILNQQEKHWYLFEMREAAGVVGRLQFWARGEAAYVHWIEVDEQMQRQGLAVQLYAELRAWCQANGVRWLNGRIENRYALQARNRVFGEPFDVESVEGFDDSSPSILLVVHEIRTPSAPEQSGAGEENSGVENPTTRLRR